MNNEILQRIIDGHGNTISNGSIINIGQISTGIYQTITLYFFSNQSQKTEVTVKIGKVLASYDQNLNPVFDGDGKRAFIQPSMFENKTVLKDIEPFEYLENIDNIVPEINAFEILHDVPDQTKIGIDPFKLVFTGLSWITPIHLVYKSRIGGQFTDTITVNGIQFTVTGEFVEQDVRLQILLNNMGVVMGDEWYQAFLSTDSDSGVDAVFMNQKRRELLLDFFTLTQLKGSYKSLYEGLGFLEYEGRIEVYEYWYDPKNDKYILVSREESRKMNQDIYQKTKYLSLHYSINVQDKDAPVDDKGIPNMVEEFVWNNEMFIKLCNLKQILQKHFLPDDILIVDIAGEHVSYAIYQTRLWPAEVKIFNNNEQEKFSGIKVEKYNPDGDENLTPIFAHELLLDLQVYGISQDTLYFKTNSAHNEQPVYRIISTNPGDAREDFEFATSIWSGDCAIVGINVLELPDKDLTYTYTLEQYTSFGWQRIYARRNFTKQTLDRELKFAIRTAGKYRVIFYAFDKYGDHNAWSYEFNCDYPSFIPRARFLIPQYISEKNTVFSPRHIIFDNAYEINNELYSFGARDLASTTYDVNDLYSSVEDIVRRYGKSDKDNEISLLTLQQLRTVELSRLKNVPLSEYSDGYEVLIFELSDIPSSGNFHIRAFKSDDENVIEYKSYIELLSKVYDYQNENLGIWYSIDIQPIQTRNDDGELGPTRLAFILFAKERGVDLREFEFLVNNTPIKPIRNYSIFPYFSKGPSMRFYADENDTVFKEGRGPLIVKYGTHIFKTDDAQILDIETFYNWIKDLPDLIVTMANGMLSISSLDCDLEIIHPSIGHRYEPFRKSPIEYLYDGKSSRVIEPGTYIFAICDTDWKLDNYEIIWKITDSISGDEVHNSIGYMLKWTSIIAGSYDVQLTVIDKRTQQTMTSIAKGAITIL